MRGKTDKGIHSLTLPSIQRACEGISAELTERRYDRRDILSVTLSLEDILLTWKEALGENSVCLITSHQNFGRYSITVSVEGMRVDPYATDDDGEMEAGHGILASIGLAPCYSYDSGINSVVFSLRRNRAKPVLRLIVSVVLALALWGLSFLLPKGSGEALSTNLIEPLLGAFMGFLSAVVGPLLFVTIICGIMSMGSISTLGKIGKKTILMYVGMTFIFTLFAMLAVLPIVFKDIVSSSTGVGGVSDIFQVVLNIIPSNGIMPFLNGNALQILFLGAVIGVVMLSFGTRIKRLPDIVSEINLVAQSIMKALSAFVPVFVFLSLSRILLSNRAALMVGALMPILLAIALNLLCSVASVIWTSFRLRIKLSLLFKKIAPSWIIATTTASSAAAFSSGTSACKNQLGISERLINFGYPLGQMLSKAGAGIAFVVMAVLLARAYGTQITIPWLIIAVLECAVMALATPPIPGGSLSCYTIVFTQLGLPEETIAIAIAADTILDFFMTGTGNATLQTTLALTANKLSMIDMSIARKPVSKKTV